MRRRISQKWMVPLAVAIALTCTFPWAQAQTANMTVHGNINVPQGSIVSEEGLMLFKANATTKVGLANCWNGPPFGVQVDANGVVGIGNLNIMGVAPNPPMEGYVQITNESPTILGQNFVGINTYYDNTDGTFRCYGAEGTYGAGVYSSAILTGNQAIAGAVPSPRDTENKLCGIVVTPKGTLGVGMGVYDNPVSTIPGISDPGKRVRLDVVGAIALRNIDSTATMTGYIFGQGNQMKVRDASGTQTGWSPHADPREKFPQAITSFGDPAVTLPFSMHHENMYTGKGAYVDMAKLVGYLEKKMQTELGTEAGRLVFVYDLPPASVRTAADYEVDLVLGQLEQMKPIKVELGADGSLPAQAVEAVDEVVQEGRDAFVPERTLDLEARRVVVKQVKRRVSTEVRTGRKVNRLKAGWAFKDGELYRLPTVQDLDVDAIVRGHPRLPQWVRERMKSGLTSGQSLSSLVQEIRSRIAALTPPDKPAVTASASAAR